MEYKLLCGDAIEQLHTLPSNSVNTCITSPPYFGLRDYGNSGQIGLEKTPDEYINRLVDVFREVKRVLRDDGILWVNIGDSYSGSNKCRNKDGKIYDLSKSTITRGSGSSFGNLPCGVVSDGMKPKDLMGVPWMLAFALRADGWYLRQDIIWAKNNPMPESVKDRCTRSHEYIFMLTKSRKYWFDHEAIQEDANPKYAERYNKPFMDKAEQNYPHPRGGHNTGGMKKYNGKRNKRDVWRVSVCSSVSEAHFAVFPKELVEPCVLAGCPRDGVVLDPFNGSGTTGIVALNNHRNYIGVEINPEYIEITRSRFKKELTVKEDL